MLEDLPNKIRSKLGITPFVREEIQNGESLLNIETPCSSFPVSCDGKFYIRAGSTTQELSGKELSSKGKAGKGIAYQLTKLPNNCLIESEFGE